MDEASMEDYHPLGGIAHLDNNCYIASSLHMILGVMGREALDFTYDDPDVKKELSDLFLSLLQGTDVTGERLAAVLPYIVGDVNGAAEQQDCNSCLMMVVDKYWQMMQLEYVEGGKLRLEMMINLPLIEGEGSSVASPYRMLSQGIRALQCPPDTKEIITISFKTYFLVLISRTAWNMELKQVTKLHHAVHDVMAV
jgi:hypothetical protein